MLKIFYKTRNELLLYRITTLLSTSLRGLLLNISILKPKTYFQNHLSSNDVKNKMKTQNQAERLACTLCLTETLALYSVGGRGLVKYGVLTERIKPG